MKKRNLKRILFLMIFPVVNLTLIISVAMAFSTKTEGKKIKNEIKENEKIISVYFHTLNEVKTIPIEEYLLGVIPAEMPPSFNEEALKAQAVAARTFIMNRENTESPEHKGAVVCTDFNHCKAYITEDEAVIKWGTEWNTIYKDKIKTAVADTRGMVVTYNDELISAVFHSTSSGKTENSEDVWQSALPYLRSVESEGEEKSPRYTSNETFSLDEFKNIIQTKNPNASFQSSPSKWIGNISYNESGSVKTIEIGKVTFKGTDIRSLFNLRSANFKIDVDDEITFNVTGNGHGVGMSQYGANYAAQNGYSYEQILKKYYQGVEVKKIY